MARILETLYLQGPAGRLECLHEGPEEDVRIRQAAVVCHPHPLFGGTLHNKVVFRLARAARNADAAVLRFNFRGVGQSAGEHDDGLGEQDDVRAAARFMKDRYPGLPLVLAGFSFGASMSLRVACGDPTIARVIAAGTPVNRGGFGFLASCGAPKHFLHSTNDEHGARDKMEAAFEMAAPPKKLDWIEAKDHFFVDALDAFESAALKAFQL
ncbi:MAG: hypothetical protein GC160_29810 [Acidobacteria bacterium]|nr:hypothetical protein [Acidobacteriota bacterium]